METFESIVSAYIRDCRDGASREQRLFGVQRRLEDAVRLAALAQTPGGKRLSHQCRIPRHVLAECEKRLLSALAALEACRTFEELHDLVISIVGNVRGVGELYVYDTALRIGEKLDLHPRLVFL